MTDDKKPENPAAFPRPAFDSDGVRSESQEGMTLRDWFAGQALASDKVETTDTVKEAAEVIGIDPKMYDWRIHHKILVARACYDYADAMLAERERRKP